MRLNPFRHDPNDPMFQLVFKCRSSIWGTPTEKKLERAFVKYYSKDLAPILLSEFKRSKYLICWNERHGNKIERVFSKLFPEGKIIYHSNNIHWVCEGKILDSSTNYCVECEKFNVVVRWRTNEVGDDYEACTSCGAKDSTMFLGDTVGKSRRKLIEKIKSKNQTWFKARRTDEYETDSEQFRGESLEALLR